MPFEHVILNKIIRFLWIIPYLKWCSFNAIFIAFLNASFFMTFFFSFELLNFLQFLDESLNCRIVHSCMWSEAFSPFAASPRLSTMLPNCPTELNFLVPFLQRASEMAESQPVLAYYCKFYAVSLALRGGPNKFKRTPQSDAFLAQLFDDLESVIEAKTCF